jgi:hypothetical protein
MSGHCPETFRTVSFLGALKKLRKVTVTFMSARSLARPPARPIAHVQHHVSHWTDFHEI